MAEIIFILIFAFPAILGLAEILHILKIWIVSSGKNGKRLFVVVPDNKNFIKQILGTYEEVKWRGNKLAHKIIVVDSLLDDAAKAECKRLSQTLGFEICSKSEILDLVLEEAE